MTDAELIAIRSMLFLVLGIIWYVWPYHRLRVAAYREDLFTIRDELWDYMYHEGLSHNEPAHRRLRQLINGFIRLAPVLGVGSLISAWFTPTPATSKPGMLHSIRQIDNLEHKTRLYKSLNDVSRRTFRFIFLEGILGLVFWPIVGVVQLQAIIKHKIPPSEPNIHMAGRRMAQNALFVGQASRQLARQLVGG